MGAVNLEQLVEEGEDCGNSLWDGILCKHHAPSQPLGKDKLSGHGCHHPPGIPETLKCLGKGQVIH